MTLPPRELRRSTNRLGLALLLLLGSTACAYSQLRLVATLDGRTVELKDVGANRYIARDGARSVGVPLDARISLEGDLQREAHFIHWCPTYYLVHPTVRDRLPSSARPWFGYVRLVNGDRWTRPRYDHTWPTAMPDPALAVLAWVVQGKVVRTSIHRLPSDPHEESFRVAQLFHLSEAEASGHGVALVWTKGRFVAPRPTFRDPKVQTALHHVMFDNTAALVTDLKAGLNPNVMGRNDETLLQYAAKTGRIAAIEALVAHGAKVDHPWSYTPLSHAAETGRTTAVVPLLAANADPHLAYLGVALAFGHDELVRRVLRSDLKANGGDRILLEVALENGHADLARQLMSSGIRERISSDRRAEMLMDQIKFGRTGTALLLLEQKADPNQPVDDQYPLIVATRARDSAIVEALLKAGAKSEVTDDTGATCLILASIGNDVDCVEALLAAGANINARRHDGYSALHFAAAHDSPALINLLLKHRADIGALGPGNLTPLELALLSGAGSAARILAENGGNVRSTAVGGTDLITAAVTLDVVEVVRSAIEADWQPSWSPVLHAQLENAPRVRELLEPLRPEGVKPPHIIPADELDNPPRLLESPRLYDRRELHEAAVPPVLNLQVIVDDQGRMVTSRIHSSPSGRLSVALLHAPNIWRFTVPRKNGLAVYTTMNVRYVFEPPAQEIEEGIKVDAAPTLITYRRTNSYVRAQVVIGTDGHLRAPEALHRASSAVLLDGLDWAYTPGVRNGVPVPTRIQITIKP